MRTRGFPLGRRAIPLVALSLVALAPLPVSAGSAGLPDHLAPFERTAPPEWRSPSDPRDQIDCRGRSDRRDRLIPLLRRINRFFERNETDGVTIDSRWVLNYTEAVRQSVVSQLLAYDELYKVYPTRRFRQDIVHHADFLVSHLDVVRSQTPFDGMLGLSLLGAYEATRDSAYLAPGTVVVRELEAMPTGGLVLNGGLMAAMALAEYGRLTGEAEAAQKALDILALLPAYQNGDGSFPHWCPSSEDVHYTDWMAMELILLERMTHDPSIEPMLGRMRVFLEARVDSEGRTHYQEACADYPGCTVYYYSIASGCWYDYDTRGWSNELGYSALFFDHVRSPRYRPVMSFLDSLEKRGAIPDKWDFWPPLGDPYYPWAISDTSVVNMSLIFWSLACTLTGREDRRSSAYAWASEDEDGDDEAIEAPEPAGPSVRHEGAPSRRWGLADSLFVAGVSPAAGCDGAPDATRDPGERPIPTRPAAGRLASGGAGLALASPAALRLGPILPNPVRDGCEVRFSLPAPTSVSLAIFDASGRRVRDLVAGPRAAGEQQARWDRRDAAGGACPSGLYFLRLRAGAEIRSARILLLH